MPQLDAAALAAARVGGRRSLRAARAERSRSRHAVPGRDRVAARRRARPLGRRAIRSRRVARSRRCGSRWCCCRCWRCASAAAGSACGCSSSRAPLPRAHAFEWQDLWQRPDQRGFEALEAEQADARRGAVRESRVAQCRAVSCRAVRGERRDRSPTIDSADRPLQPRQRARESRASSRRPSVRTTARSSSTRAMRTRATTAICVAAVPEGQPASSNSSRRTRARASRASRATRISRRGRAASSRTASSRPTSSKASRASKAKAVRRQARRRRAGSARTTRTKASRKAKRDAEQNANAGEEATDEATASAAGRRGRRAMGVGAGGRAVAAPRAARSRWSAAPQVPVPIPAPRRRPRTAIACSKDRRGAAAVVSSAPARRWLALARGSSLVAAVPRRAPRSRCRRASTEPSVRDNESFTLRVARRRRRARRARARAARGAVRRSEHLEQPPHRHRRTAVRPRSSSGSFSSCRKPRASSRSRRCASAIGRSNPVTVRVLAPEPGASRRGRHLHGARREPSTSCTRSRKCCSRCGLFVGVSTGRATLTTPETSGRRSDRREARRG